MVHYNEAYGSFENAQCYPDGVCVVAIFLSVYEHYMKYNFFHLLKYFITVQDKK